MGANMPNTSHLNLQFNCCPRKITLNNDCDQWLLETELSQPEILLLLYKEI